MQRAFLKLSLNDKAIPFILLFVTFISFGLLIPWLGFFWDDWPVIYLIKTQGISGFRDFYQYDRPFSAWTYIVFSPILGTSPLGWHIFTLLLRWSTAVFLWLSLRLIWYKKPQPVLWIAILFAVCPIFIQQPVAVAYSQHWICYLFYFCSVYLMLKAQEGGKYSYLLTAFAIFLSLVQMLTMEYFLGLELLRLVILWLYYRESEPQASVRLLSQRVIASGWLYMVSLLAYVTWRVFFLRLADVDPNRPVFFQAFLKTPIQTLIDISQKAIQDFIYLLISWIAAIRTTDIELQRPFSLAAIAITIFTAVLLWMLLSRYQRAWENGHQDNWPLYAILFGILAVLLGTLPVWLIDRQVSLGPLGRRFSLAAMFGISVLIVGLLEWLSTKNKAKLTVICMLVGIAIHTNLYTAKAYQQSWEKQRTFYWQMFWRAPYIQPGTAIISNGEVFEFVGLYSTSMGITLLYPPPEEPQEMPYWFFSYWERLYLSPNDLLAGTPLDAGIRNYSFRGHSSEALMLDFAPEVNQCLQFISLRESKDIDLPGSLRGVLSISDLGKIQREPPTHWNPPESIFGREPEHGWCYYYEKAELARQYADWSEVIRLMNEAKAAGFAPSEMKEYLPLLDAYVQTSNIESAFALSLQMRQLSNKIDDRVCTAWLDEAEVNSSPEFTAAFDKIRRKFSCFD